MKPLKTRHAASGKKQRAIVQAALRCFAEKGYTNTRITDICGCCNANTGSIYHHFKSKEGLAAQVYLEGIRDYQSGFVRVLDREEGAREGIYALVAYHLSWVETHREWARFLIQKRHAEFMGTAADRLKDLNQKFMSRAGNWFKGHIDSGVLKPLAGPLYIAILLGPCQEYARLFVSGALESPDVEKASGALGEAAWLSLRKGDER